MWCNWGLLSSVASRPLCHKMDDGETYELNPDWWFHLRAEPVATIILRARFVTVLGWLL